MIRMTKSTVRILAGLAFLVTTGVSFFLTALLFMGSGGVHSDGWYPFGIVMSLLCGWFGGYFAHFYLKRRI